MAVLAMITFRDLTFEVPRDFLSNIVDTMRKASRSDLVTGEQEPVIHNKCQGSEHQVRRSQDRRAARRNRTLNTVIRRE